MSNELTHFLVASPFYWGKGATLGAAKTEFFRVSGRKFDREPIRFIFRVSDDAYVDGLGRLIARSAEKVLETGAKG